MLWQKQGCNNCYPRWGFHQQACFCCQKEDFGKNCNKQKIKLLGWLGESSKKKFLNIANYFFLNGLVNLLGLELLEL